MAPKAKKTKAEEALDFLSNLDNLDAPPAPADAPNPSVTVTGGTPSAASASAAASGTGAPTGETPRASIDSTRKSLSASREIPASTSPAGAGKEDEEAASALAFLEAQINQKRAPLSKPLSSANSRAGTPVQAAIAPPPVAATSEPSNLPTQAAGSSGGGWGVSSFWSTAATALQSAQRVADEQYQKVKSEGVSGVTGQLEQLGVKGVGGVDLNKLRKGAEERLGGIVKGVDLEKLRHDLVNTTTSTLTTILDTVAPPISEHETLELWLSHPMTGYGGVEGVIYRAWTRILEQTESGELVVVWSPPPTPADGEKEATGSGARSINPIEGWETAYELAKKGIEEIKAREEAEPQGRAKVNPNVPVTTIPIFLHLQPLLVTLPIPEPPILTSTPSTTPHTPPKHLYFLLTLQDPSHSLTFSTTTQPTPSDWMEVEYEKSEWVEERLVEVLRTGVEVIAQDYVATRMGLKPSAPQAAAVAALVEQAGKDGEISKVKEAAGEVEVKAE